jgi:hypothetical protein
MRIFIFLFFLSACQNDKSTYVKVSPVSVQGPEVSLTPEAIKRLELRVIKLDSTVRQVIIPNSAVIYDPQGNVWVYIEKRAGTFERVQIEVKKIKVKLATVEFHLPLPHKLVVSGVAELYGAESGVGK